MAVRAARSASDIARVLDTIDVRSDPGGHLALCVLAGLPATGKSWLAAELRDRTGAVVLESDALRRLFAPRPAYSPSESRRLFAAIHGAIEALLTKGIPVILDATNLREIERRPLYDMAARFDARLVLVQVTAPVAVAQQRLSRRASAEEGFSQADNYVYEHMRRRAQELSRAHHVVDTSRSTQQAVSAIVKEMTE